MSQQKNTTVSTSALFRIRDPSVLKSPVPLSSVSKHANRHVTNSVQSQSRQSVAPKDEIPSPLPAPSVVQTTVAPQPQFPFLRSPVPYPTFASPNLQQQRPSAFPKSSFTASMLPVNRVLSPPTNTEPTTCQTLGVDNVTSLAYRGNGTTVPSKNIIPAKVSVGKAPKGARHSKLQKERNWYSNSTQPQRTQNQALPSSLYSLFNSFAQSSRASVAPINHQIQRKNTSLSQSSTAPVMESNSCLNNEEKSQKPLKVSEKALSCTECDTLLVKWWFQPHVYERGQPAVIVKGLRLRTGLPLEEWKSSYIVCRLSDCHVKTVTDKIYHLDGPINETEMQRVGYSSHVIRGFQDGIPSHWASLLNVQSPTVEKRDHSPHSTDSHPTSLIPDMPSNNTQSTASLASTTDLRGTPVPNFTGSDDSYPLIGDTPYMADLAMDIVTTGLSTTGIPQTAPNGLSATNPFSSTISHTSTSPALDQGKCDTAALKSDTQLSDTSIKQSNTRRGRNMAKCSRGRGRTPQSAPRHVGNRSPAPSVTPKRSLKRKNVTPKTAPVASLKSPIPLKSTSNVKVKYVWGSGQAFLEVDGQRMGCDMLDKLTNQEGAMTRSQRRRLFSSLGPVTSPATPTPSYQVVVPESPHKRPVATPKRMATKTRKTDNPPIRRSTRKKSPSKTTEKRTVITPSPPVLPEPIEVDCISSVPEIAADETPSLLVTSDTGSLCKSIQLPSPTSLNSPPSTAARVSTRFIKRRTNYNYTSSFSPIGTAIRESQDIISGTYDLSDE
ncbi:hypothetical protein IWQ62_003099 [Dispira parvispora]|uniref:SANTA domain-containing protein n=1 Tax=Dispira parvispora TaxID=1520584 RepID=A0A9W8AP93_9FUNG|nr:hypothetical protein IWQ62_003099 [Dispira parvispora]